MGMPRQEYLSKYLKKNYNKSLIIINGGAIIGFMSESIKRSPKLIRKFKLEWFYRLLNEPIRLFYRYVIGIPIFFSRLIIQKIYEKNINNLS